ncbi:MAG: hypothetical protein ACI8RD_008206, partial [Bacillariaceae sp.]|jgi:hypothetical protein
VVISYGEGEQKACNIVDVVEVSIGAKCQEGMFRDEECLTSYFEFIAIIL